MSHLCRNQVLFFTSKMFEKHLWKSGILSKDADVAIVNFELVNVIKC